MSLEQDRLLSLIEFAKQSALSKTAPASTVSAHKDFSLHERQVQGYPGISLNLETADGEDELWLVVDRLHESKPPQSQNPILKPWLELTQGPEIEPTLKTAVESHALLGPRAAPVAKTDELPPVLLATYEQSAAVRAQFKDYLENLWRPWAVQEKRRRWSIRLYAQLFTLKQQLEGSIVDTPLELVWGVGVSVWQNGVANVSYPLISRAVELTLNPLNAAIEIRPRDIDPRMETEWYASVDNQGVSTVEALAKEFFAKATTTFSPFDRGSFEPLLQAAVTHLDPSGVYWPNEVPAEDRTLPKADDKLKVTDTWVLFARPRNSNLFIQDLENLKKRIEEAGGPAKLPKAVVAIVTDPTTENPMVDLPIFRGVSVSSFGRDSGSAIAKPRDLFFPKPSNEEQTRIVQLLEVSDGVVVQGPPGTGKTHTIANVICHYLANGKRVLVTSLKDPALAVLREKLPREIQPLAISLLTSEQEGMKQFEHSIRAIASETQGLDRQATAREIRQLEESIDALHGKLARVDRSIGEWATKNLERINIEGEEIDPQDAAKEVVNGIGHYEWISDPLGVVPEFTAKFSDQDIVRLRESRRSLGEDIRYLGCSCPQVADFPNSKELLQVHQDLSRYSLLAKEVESGKVPALADSSQETLAQAQSLLSKTEQMELLSREIAAADRPWSASAGRLLRGGQQADLLKLFESLGRDLIDAKERHKTFLQRPVEMHATIDVDPKLFSAIVSITQGNAAFGVFGLFGTSEQKKKIAAIRVLGHAPESGDEWIHVLSFAKHRKQLRELAVRWNAIARELGIELLTETEPEHGMEAVCHFELYIKIKELLAVESQVRAAARKTLPGINEARDIADKPQELENLRAALRHHLTKNRLSNVWVLKDQFQKILERRNGKIVEQIRFFLEKVLGSPTVKDADMQSLWSKLMAELVRVLDLGSDLQSVSEITERIVESGAPKLAHALRQPLSEAVDTRLPDNWKQGWRLRRLATYIESIDAQQHLKKLAKDRAGTENDLARAYQAIVAKRTWLKLAENASPSIRAALQAYLNAIQKIGKGTGKRAVRYRQDARAAARHANPAIPCWIMPHYRVSESLPPELGCFDLVIIDEASQSDFTALPALLRAEKVLIVGDDKQVSPEGVGVDEEKLRNLMSRFLGNQVPIYRPQMTPERSIYDLFKVVFARSTVMLKEHFRCVGPIIEYSKREFYNHDLRPLRVPRASERLDPPLVDVLIEDGYRDGDINGAEGRFIVDEIRKLTSDPAMSGRSIGVVSLLGSKQALAVWQMLTEELGTEVLQKHDIACGDARTFQGKERHIMFLTMVAAPNNVGAPPSREAFAQRFNVAASRAMDRMYLVRSIEVENLSQADKLRRGLLGHFKSPFAQDEARVEDYRKLCESPFEREVYDELSARGYWVTPQVKAGQYRIDMVVEGHNDTRLAVECDGDQYHGPDKWADDMQRQRVLERAGWTFWRCFASAFVMRRQIVIDDLLATLKERGIEPVGSEGAPRSVHTEQRRVQSKGAPLETSVTLAELEQV